MKANQLTQGKARRLMYIENKDGSIDGVDARIGWVTFSKSGKSVYYRNRVFQRCVVHGIRGNYYDKETNEVYWISGIKREGSNVHPCESANVAVDTDGKEEYEKIINRSL